MLILSTIICLSFISILIYLFGRKSILTSSICFLLFIIGGEVQAQFSTEGLFKRDTSLSRRGEDLNVYDGTILLLEETIIKELITTQPEELSLTIPSNELGEVTVVLKKQRLFTDGFKAKRSESNSTVTMVDLHYRGFVLNEQSSRVALSITNQEVSGLIQLPTETIAIRRLTEEVSTKHVIYNYKNHPNIAELDCEDTDTMSSYEPIKLSRTNEIGDPVCVSIRVEVDHDFKGDAPAIINQVASIYQKVGIDLKVAEIFYWDTPSPYLGTTKEIIQQLQLSLKSQANLAGDLTLFLGGKGNGGRASTVGGICDATAVCYSGQNDDVYTIAHELGHLFAAHHTHSCKWNGNNTALDGCGYNAGYGGCPGEDPLQGGTLMSYCHIRSVGINLEFHPQVAKVMYNFVKDNSSCTCQENTTAIVEEEYEEEGEVEEGDRIVANICQMTFINPNNCPIEIYPLTNQVPGELLASIDAKGSASTPIVKSVNYGIYVNGVLLDQFTAECGAVFSITSCGTEGDAVTGKVILEGFYDAYLGKMHQILSQQNLLSKKNPYTQAPWNYKGITAVTNIPPDAVDWILIMSRDAAGKVFGQSVGFINTQGQLMDAYGKLGIPLIGANGQHISIHHRGHMAIMTTAVYQSGSTIDITSSKEAVLGNGQLKQIGTIYALHAGDFDANGVINNMDYNHWVANSSKINQYIAADGDGNGVINNKDYNLWISNRSKIGYMPLHY